MKLLMTSAALLALAASAPAQAQSVGLGASGQVNPPTGAPATVPSNIGPPINGQASPPLVPGKPVPGGVIDGTAKGAIKDGRTLSTGQSVDTSANVSQSSAANQMMLAGGMRITDMGGAMELGRVISVTKDRAGKVSSVIVQTGDGVRRTMMPGGLTVKGGMAVTSQSEADLVAMPVAK
jgi:hypothetical protein